MTRRPVRCTDQFFDRLDQPLPPERGSDGGASAADFLTWDLPEAIDRFSTDLDTWTLPVPDRTGVHVLVTDGVVVRGFAVYAEVLPDGSVEVFWLDLDLGR